jgi:drug/metabolite transporter (DMT)-like permease
VSKRGWILFWVLGIIWGVPYLLIKVADGGVSVPVLVWSRVVVGAALLLPIAIARRKPGDLGRLRARWRWMLAFAMVEIIVSWALLSQAERHLPSSTSGLLIAAVPVIGAVLTLAVGGERLSVSRWVGLGTGFGGVALLAGPGAGRGDLPSVLLVLAVACCYAVGPLIAQRKLAGLPPITVNAACLSLAAIVYTPFAILTLPHKVPALKVLASLAGLGALCTATALVLLFALVSEVGPARATVITYVNPAVAVVLGVAVLGERMTPAIGVSFALILGGSVLATGLRQPQSQSVTPAPRSAWRERVR